LGALRIAQEQVRNDHIWVGADRKSVREAPGLSENLEVGLSVDH
jgi:hypothetical protein